VSATRVAVVASIPFFVNSVAIAFGNSLALSSLEFIRQDQREVGWFSAASNLASLATLLHPLVAWVVMPMLSRAKARSDAEMTSILRRALEGLVIVVAPGTLFMSAGSDVLIGLAFGSEFAPAALGFSIQSLVFLMMYTNVMLATALILRDRGWTVTLISIGSVCLLATLMLITVPLGRQYFGVGGECAGGAIAVVASEACVVVAMLTRFDDSPFDARLVSVLLKISVIAALTLTLNHYLMSLGAVRLVIVMGSYVALALATGVIRPKDVRAVVQAVKSERKG